MYQNPPEGVFLVHHLEHPPEPKKLDVEQLIRSKATEYGVDKERALKIAKCESGLDPEIQSFHIQADGTREQSFGLWQIHLPSHPDVSHEMAIDPYLSTEWAMSKFSDEQWHMWTCDGLI